MTFIPIKSHTGQALCQEVLFFLEETCKINFSKCRGQTYDNAANMSGKYNGMQQKVLQRNKYAIFVPCAAHSLNLVGRSAVDCCAMAVDFFSVAQLIIYTYFSASTHRWNVLKMHLGQKPVVKSLSDTRWEAHAVATNAILDSYCEIVDALESIADDSSQKGETVREAENIVGKIQEFEFVLMLVIWNEILRHFNNTSKALQSAKTHLAVCARLYQSLADYLVTIRNEFDRFEKLAQVILPEGEYKQVKSRKRKRKRQDNDGNASDALNEMSPRDVFRTTVFIHIVDTLQAEMKKRAKVYDEVSSRFSFLINLQLPEEEYASSSQLLLNSYPDDLDGKLREELKQLHCYIDAKFNAEKKNISHAEMYDIIFQDNIQTVFPNVEIALRIFP